MKKILAAFLMFAALGAKAALPTVGTPPGQRYMVSGASITAVNGSFSGSVTASSVTSQGSMTLGSGGEYRVNGVSGLTSSGVDFTIGSPASGVDQGVRIAVNGDIGVYVERTTRDVGIGTTSPSAKLHVKTANADRNFHVTELSGILSLIARNTADNGYVRMNIEGAPLTINSNSGDNVGIGTASPASTLDVNGNAQFGSGATKSTFTATGQLQVGGTGNSTFYGSTVTVANSGFVSAPSQPGAGANRASSALSIADSTATELLFNSNNYTQGGLGFTSKSTAPVAGIYYVGCGVSWVSNATGVRQLCIVSSNIGQEACDVRFAGAAGAAINQSISKMVSLAANDTVSCTVTQTSGGPLNAEASEMTYGVLQKVW